jgi:N-acetylglucosaminyl-diphospho-decaprenol L-rhamnosyltransferase
MNTSTTSVDLSIIVVSYNTREHLARCLRALPAATTGLAWDAIVVDNASGDGSAEMIRRDFPAVTLIANRDNVGFARACNAGLQVAGGRFLLLLNSDAVATPGSLSALVRYARAYPRVGAVGPRIRTADGRPARSCFRFPSLARPYLNIAVVQRLVGDRFGLPYAWDHPCLRDGGVVDWLSGACLLLRREALAGAGALDERYFMYFEDTDLCRRLWRAGWQVVFWPVVEVLHEGGASGRGHEGRLSVEHRRSALIYFSTHHAGLVSAGVRAITVAAALARAVKSLRHRRRERLRLEATIMRLGLRGGGR